MSWSRSSTRSQILRGAALVVAALAIAGRADRAPRQTPLGAIRDHVQSTVAPVARSVSEIVAGVERIDRIPMAAWELHQTFDQR